MGFVRFSGVSKRVAVGGFIAGASLIASSAQAAVVSNYYSVSPNDLNGSAGFFYDNGPSPAAFPPIGSQTEGTLNNNSFESQVGGAGTPRLYTTFRFTPAAVGMSGITMNQLSKLTYDSKKTGGNAANGGVNETDWQVRVYTNPVSPSDGSSFYGARLNFNPIDTTIHGWETNTLTGSTPIEGNKLGGQAEVYGGTYNSARAAPGNDGLPVGDRPIEFIDISAGYQTAGPAIEAFLDNVVLTRTVGGVDTTQSTIDLVPEPSTIGLLASFGAAALLVRRPRRARA